ncbi:MAG: hypothetical protein V9F82_02295 [Dermatophilaceae bacterium]
MPRSAVRRRRREGIAAELAQGHGGVVHRAQLLRLGVTREDVRTEVRAGRWHLAGRHTVVPAGRNPVGPGRWWWAVWESGSGAILDGVSALLAQGLSGFHTERMDVTVPGRCTAYRLVGVTLHRRREIGPALSIGVPRARPESAVIRAAQWAGSDRQAALLVGMPVQQRLVSPDRLLRAWAEVTRSPRRALLDSVVRDVCSGAQSLGELDFARWCRRYRLPEPNRQSVCRGRSGRVYLDVEWTTHGVVVEIDGGHHLAGLNPLDDALRSNELVLDGRRVLRLPVLGLRLEPAAFMAQVARALRLPVAVMPNAGDSPRSA